MSQPVLQRIQKHLQPEAAAIAKANETHKPKMQDVINKLSDAIRASDQPVIRRHLKTLEGQVAVYSGLLVRAKKLLTELEKLEPAEGEELKKVEALTKTASELHGKVFRNYTNLKQLMDMANDKLSKPAGADAMEEWAEMEAWLKQQLDLAKVRLKQLQTVRQLAKQSIAAGDAASLAQALEKNNQRPNWKPTQKEIEEKFSKFCAECEGGLNKSLQDQLKRDREKFKKIVADIAALNKQMDEIHAEVKDLKAPAAARAKAVDHRKAAVLLKVPASHEAKLKKALEANGAMEKSLDAIAKELKLKTTGRDMVAALRKAKVLA